MKVKQAFVYYHFVKTPLDHHLEEKCYSLLPKVITERVRQFIKREDRLISLVGKLLLLHGLKTLQLDQTHLTAMAYTHTQRPYLASLPHFDFNISHSHQLVVCAMSLDTQVGIDTEYFKELNLLALKEQCSPQQWAAIEQAENPQQLFYQFWVQKEALVKADGAGMEIPFAHIDIEFGKANIKGRDWYLQSLDMEDRKSVV